MVKNPACAPCGKDAIGFPSSGCGFAGVCQDQAYSILPAPKTRAYTTVLEALDRLNATGFPFIPNFKSA
jgi:hypothetical protein